MNIASRVVVMILSSYALCMEPSLADDARKPRRFSTTPQTAPSWLELTPGRRVVVGEDGTTFSESDIEFTRYLHTIFPFFPVIHWRTGSTEFLDVCSTAGAAQRENGEEPFPDEHRYCRERPPLTPAHVLSAVPDSTDRSTAIVRIAANDGAWSGYVNSARLQPLVPHGTILVVSWPRGSTIDDRRTPGKPSGPHVAEGTRLRVLEQRITGYGSAYRVEVVTGPHRGARGWSDGAVVTLGGFDVSMRLRPRPIVRVPAPPH